MATAATADTMVTRLAALELRRIALLVTADSASIPAIDGELSSLRARTRVLIGSEAAARLMGGRVAQAIDDREAAVGARVRELRVVYPETYPTLRQAVAEQRLLQTRKRELLRTSL